MYTDTRTAGTRRFRYTPYTKSLDNGNIYAFNIPSHEKLAPDKRVFGYPFLGSRIIIADCRTN